MAQLDLQPVSEHLDLQPVGGGLDLQPYEEKSFTPETDKSLFEQVVAFAKKPSPAFLQPFEKAITSPLPGAKEAIHAGYQYGSPLGWIEDLAPDSAAGKWAHDIRTRLEEVGTGFASPANIALAATGAGTGKAIQGLIGLGFTAEQAKTTLDTYREWQQATDPEEKHQLGIKLGVDTGLTALLGGGTVAGHLAPERAARTAPEEAPATVTLPEAQTRPSQATPAPETPIAAPLETETQRITPEEVTPNAQQPSNAQVQGGEAPLGVETRPAGKEPKPSDSDNVIRETSGEKPVVEGAAPQEAPPVAAGEPKPSKIGQSIEAKAVEAKLTEGFSETALYDPITIADQAQRATDLVKSSPDTARAIIRGDEPLPQGLRGTSLITAMEERLLEKPDPQAAYELANSPLTSATSAAAQEMRLMAERVPDSITAKFEEIRRAREAGSKQRGDTPEKVAVEVQREIVKNSSKRPTWEAFVREITCA